MCDPRLPLFSYDLMLRLLVLILLLANGLFYAWSEGWLRAYGFAPASVSEPQRVQQQIKPENVTLISAKEVEQAQVQAQSELAAKACLQAGPFDDAQASQLRKALDASLPSGSWQLETVKEPGRWMVYMGKYATPDLLAKKRAELSDLGIKAERVTEDALAPGLSLGRFESEAAAKTELTRLAGKGVHSAKAVQERAPGTASMLKLPAVGDDIRAKLEDVKPALAGKALLTCS